MTEQIRLRTLLREDPMFKAWFQKVPKLTVVHSTPPWRLFVQLEEGGRWARVDIRGYSKAFAQVKLRLPDAWDMALHCKPQPFNPPVIKVNGKRTYNSVPDGHRWCVHCRRPTVFKRFRKHPNVKFPVNPEEKRCSICGSRLASMKEFRSTAPYPSSTTSQ